MAESLLHRHLYLDENVDEKLINMDNPYDPDARESLGIDVKWDHAYYNGHYYMYFGIIPVLLLFLPYRIITGNPLTTFHATQIFTAFIIFGMFALLHYLRNNFFKKMNELTEIALSAAFSLASVWYFVEAPALYCTAISSAVCMIIWFLYFFLNAVYSNFSFNKRIIYGFTGSIFGALSFGCRPPIGMANIILIPLFLHFIRKNKIKGRNWIKTIVMFLPYLIIGFFLMAYNYARFDNIFEFGQSYQMTFYDQHNIGFASNFGLQIFLNGIKNLFFAYNGFTDTFPYVKFAGIFIEFPIFFIGVCGFIFSGSIRKQLQKTHLYQFVIGILFSILIIAIFEIAMSPIILERYHSDFYFLLGIFTFIIIGCFYLSYQEKNTSVLDILFLLLSLLTGITAVLLFFVPNDLNFTQYYYKYFDSLVMKFPKLK